MGVGFAEGTMSVNRQTKLTSVDLLVCVALGVDMVCLYFYLNLNLLTPS